MKSKVRKCLFPVAGMGTRFLPATKEIPKEMLPLIDRPLIHYGVEEAVDSGCSDVVFVTGRGKRAIEDYFDRSWELERALIEKGKTEQAAMIKMISNMANFSYVRQPEPLGLGHAVLCGESFCGKEYFGVILPDDVMISIPGEGPVLEQLVKVHCRLGGSVIALEEVPLEDTSRYGIIEGDVEEDGIYRVRDLVEKPEKGKAPGRLAVMGRYVLSPGIFDHLRTIPRGAGGEIQLTDAIRALLREEPVRGVIYKGRRYDCGTMESWLRATVSMSLQNRDF
ncbi:MAG TPA: UTP--glucose-1-phosphate uridylyltransferase GalU [Synergistetes bacterium]|nr:UTP--glucose-1-phosphate uridylyltransferase GalU [Synergistota bacterium]